MTYPTIFIAMLSIAAGQSVDIGTGCECSVAVESSATTYDVGTTLQGSLTAESADPLDVWSGVNVIFHGTYLSPTEQTFDYRIDCARPCSISQVDITGEAWCDGTLQLYNADRSELLGERDLNLNDAGPLDYAIVIATGTKYLSSFRLVETDVRCTGWRARSSLSFVAETLATGADILALQSADNAMEARLRELEEWIQWKDTLLSMSAAKKLRSAEEDMGPSAGATVSDLSAHGMQALVVCLAVVNVVLLGCLCVNSRSFKSVVYDAVRASDQEELCA